MLTYLGSSLFDPTAASSVSGSRRGIIGQGGDCGAGKNPFFDRKASRLTVSPVALFDDTALARSRYDIQVAGGPHYPCECTLVAYDSRYRFIRQRTGYQGVLYVAAAGIMKWPLPLHSSRAF